MPTSAHRPPESWGRAMLSQAPGHPGPMPPVSPWAMPASEQAHGAGCHGAGCHGARGLECSSSSSSFSSSSPHFLNQRIQFYAGAVGNSGEWELGIPWAGRGERGSGRETQNGTLGCLSGSFSTGSAAAG